MDYKKQMEDAKREGDAEDRKIVEALEGLDDAMDSVERGYIFSTALSFDPADVEQAHKVMIKTRDWDEFWGTIAMIAVKARRYVEEGEEAHFRNGFLTAMKCIVNESFPSIELISKKKGE